MKRRVLVLLTALLMGLAMSAGPVLASGGHTEEEKGKEKVCVKHYTSSKKNKYHYISISKKAFYKGHKKQHGDKIVSNKYCMKKDAGEKKDADSCFLPEKFLCGEPKDDGKDKKDKKKGYICHATGSETNPYVLIRPSKNSAHFTKHEDDKKPTWVKGKPSCAFPKKS